MAGPSQPQVTDEVWDDARIKTFLRHQPQQGAADFHVLTKAYRGMRPADFERFLRFFVEAGRDLDSKDAQGRSIWDIMARHRQGADFIAIREKLDKNSSLQAE